MIRPVSPQDRQRVLFGRLIVGRLLVWSLILVTSLFPLLFVSLDESTLLLAAYVLLAKVGSLVGGMLMVWQFFLGFRGVLTWLFPDLVWVLQVHKRLGQYGVPLVVLHPVFITLYYAESFGINPLVLDLSRPSSRYVLLGVVLLAVVAFIVVTSAFFRRRMRFYRWFYTHLSAYLVPPLFFLHSLFLGSTLDASPVLRGYWWFWAGLVAAYGAYRIVHKLGLFARRYRVSSRRPVAAETTQVNMHPLGRALDPAQGQFVYLREGVFRNAHPYTVSHFDETTGELGVTPKALGPQSRFMQEVDEGAEFLVDGPYGIFTRVAVASDMPLVMIAGGIGITPFRRLWQRVERDRDREAYLFYGSELLRDVVYREELARLEHVRVIHVLNQQPEYPGEQGFITVDVLRKHTRRDLSEYQILLCGPPVMVAALEGGLADAGVPAAQVQHELFSN